MDNLISIALATLKTVRKRYPFSPNHYYYKRVHRIITRHIEPSYLTRFYGREDYVSLDLFKRILKLDTASIPCDRLSYLALLILLRNQQETEIKYQVKFLEIVNPAHIFLCLFPFSDDITKKLSSISNLTPKKIVESDIFEGVVILDIWVNGCFIANSVNIQKWLKQLKQYDSEDCYSLDTPILINNKLALNHQSQLDKNFCKNRALKKLHKEFCINNKKTKESSYFVPVDEAKKKYRRYLIMKLLNNPFSWMFYLISFMMVLNSLMTIMKI